MAADSTTERPTDLAGIVHLGTDLVAEHGLATVLGWGGQLGNLLARTNDAGARAWTMDAAAASVGLELADALGAFALWRGAYESWATHAADIRLGELNASQGTLELEGEGPSWGRPPTL